MTGDRFFLIPIALGHLALFVLVVNVIHGFGHPERVMERAKLVLVAVFIAISGVIAWEASQGAIEGWSWPSLVYSGVCGVTGLVVFPAMTAYLLNRPVPVGIREQQRVIDLTESIGADALTGTGKYARLLRLPGNESFRLRTAEWQVPLACLPRALDGLSILHLSDLHLAPCFDLRYFEAVFEQAATVPSDLVLFTGDLVDSDEAMEWVAPLFSRLKGRLGACAILGNHDLSHDPARLSRLLGEAGFLDLEGRWTTVEAEGARIALGGTSFPWGPALPLEERPTADVSILLSHAPDLFYWAERARFDLMLSGHNHGGQIRLPLIGPVFMPSRYSRRFDRGFFRRGALTLHVSQGVAGKHPVRYGCVPEIGRLVLRAVDPDGATSLSGSRRRASGRPLRNPRR